MKRLLAAALLAGALAAPAHAQEIPAPPPGGIVPRERAFALGLGAGSFRWDDDAPYDDFAMTTLAIERKLMSVLRGRAQIGYGETTVFAPDPADTRVTSLDVQFLVLPDFGPLHAAGVMPYALGGVGSLIVNPVGGSGLPTRSQSQIAWGGGVLARLGSRWEARGEATRARVRLADLSDPTSRETSKSHTLRWEGRILWLF